MRRHSKSRARASNLQEPLSVARAFDSELNPSRPVRPSPLAASTISGMPLDLVDRIRQFPFFSSAPDEFLVAIGSHLRLQVHAPQDLILSEGESAKAMYWLVRGSVKITSRDRESTYAELKPGAFFGEIGILMNVPRTANVIAGQKCLVLRLNKEDLQKELPQFPQVERAILDEASERLSILEQKKQAAKPQRRRPPPLKLSVRNRKRSVGNLHESEEAEAGLRAPQEDGQSKKKRKSPSPALVEPNQSSALGSASVNIRQLLRQLPLFAGLPDEVLHFLGLNSKPKSYDAFTNIIEEGSTGHEVFFITQGEVEIYTGDPSASAGADTRQRIKARLRPGQYFGEVTSLSLAPERTASVRSVTSVECLAVTGDVLSELWRICPPGLREKLEATAKIRMKDDRDPDIDMKDIPIPSDSLALDDLALEDVRPPILTPSYLVPRFHEPSSPITAGSPNVENFDPDPFLSPDQFPWRTARSRRGSLANLPIDGSPLAEGQSPPQSPMPRSRKQSSHELERFRRPQMIRRHPSQYGKGSLPDSVLIRIFQYLDVYQLMRLRRVSLHWSRIISSSQDIMHYLDLSVYSRKVTDAALIEVICPFVGTRPRFISISNCYHVTDEGFNALIATCAENLQVLKMKSVWDISATAVVEMSNKAKLLAEVDFSNCRKVSDNLLGRVIGWSLVASANNNNKMVARAAAARNSDAPALTVGCPYLRILTLSYCKHVSDKFMAHLAYHASDRIEEMDLTRCTTITDLGFRHWGESSFPRLRRLVLADCTYLSDAAIASLSHSARQLEELDLSFCCALSDASVLTLARGLQQLKHLSLAFCGSAVSDASMEAIGYALSQLVSLSVRGCVRVTGRGVEAVLSGCEELTMFDVSQCRNLGPWVSEGGVEKAKTERGCWVCTVSEGRWKVGS